MAPMAQEIAEMVDMLPENDQNLAYELINKLVLAWDPDFTKLTSRERQELEKVESEGYVTADSIDWN